MDPAAILPVADMAVAVEFYQAMGLAIEPYDDNYAFVVAEGTMLCHLRVVEGLDVAGNHAALYVQVGDADVVHGIVTAAGLEAAAPEDMPWGMREFSLTDPSGNLIRVGHSLEHGHSA